jgi:pilus assembly protein TadC
MNLLKFLPKKFKESYEKNIINTGTKTPSEGYITKVFFIGMFISILLSIVLFFLVKISPILIFIASFLVLQVIFYYWTSLNATTRIKKMEDMFPDFIQLMSSNLRAGLTVDHAFLSSARPELAPLDAEILRTGREIATGKDVVYAFKNMAERIGSEKISKIIDLIISGLKAGGNIATLLENTAGNMREKEFLEKRAASNVLMYVIFIFVAIGLGAPLLFGLSSILVEIIIKLTSQLPSVSSTQMSMPFTLSNIGLSPAFIIYFSLVFLIVVDVISCLVIGLVNKGDEKYG